MAMEGGDEPGIRGRLPPHGGSAPTADMAPRPDENVPVCATGSPAGRGPSDMPWAHGAILTQMDELRMLHAHQTKEKGEPTQVPRVPLTKQEIRDVLYRQLESDEQRILQQLSNMGSVSAGIITKLKLTRLIVKETYSRLRHERTAQMTLTGVPGATRKEFALRGHLLRANCPKCKCAPDSYEHMIDCYGLRQEEATGIGAITFLAKMAVRVTTSPPNLIFPIMTELVG